MSETEDRVCVLTLRTAAKDPDPEEWDVAALLNDAANEIERLRKAVGENQLREVTRLNLNNELRHLDVLLGSFCLVSRMLDETTAKLKNAITDVRENVRENDL